MSNSVGRILKLPAGKTEPRTKYFARVLFSPQKEYIICIYTVYIIHHGWDFAHLFSERIARFLPKNEQMSDSLKKISNSLICSFLVSNLSNLLTIAHFLWAMWANHFWWATRAICSHRSEEMSKRVRIAHIAHQ